MDSHIAELIVKFKTLQSDLSQIIRHFEVGSPKVTSRLILVSGHLNDALEELSKAV
jgi:hypothetical protein